MPFDFIEFFSSKSACPRNNPINRHGPRLNADNLLSTIPGALLGTATASLPTAETSSGQTQRMVLRLPDGARAEVTFSKLSSKKGRSTRWFWTPVAAVLLEEEGE